VGFSGVEVTEGKISVRFRSAEGEMESRPTGFRIVGKLGHPHPIFVDGFKFLKSVARETPKVTFPSPTLLHFRGGRDAIDRTAYPDMDGFYADLARVYAEEIADLAAAGCRYIQIDETNFAYLCDETLRRQVQTSIGEDPATLPRIYAKLINDAIAGRPKDMVVCIHICRGNSRSAWVAEGGYEPVADVLFNEIDVDGYFLEYDSPRAGDFAPLRFLPKGKIAVLGLVTTKLPELESKDELKRRIDEAARYAPLDQLALSPQCGFASVAEGNKVTVADETAKLRRVVEVAREVWG
jgi:5-methyltetrahydropteroyltriglutamate--homocysteine methyltransferase